MVEIGNARQRDALIGKMTEGTTGLVSHFTIYLGDLLGYYRVLARYDHLDTSELATLTGTHERYTRKG